ncbi:MAG TPA: hypothetical protein GYA10_15865 [Alphaproteobacteria bacterium]|nr:hypothetical protein [Alphaproteobacteria bacterium]
METAVRIATLSGLGAGAGEVVSAMYDREGRCIERDPARVGQRPEPWTFGRERRAARAKWPLIATQSGE